MNQPPEPLLFISKFSEVQTVASRNSLYQILAINVALGAEEKARVHAGEIATANFREFLFHALG
jgi:hypothetical protein